MSTNQTNVETTTDTEPQIETEPTVEVATIEPNREIESDTREESAHIENIAIVPEFDAYGYVGDRGSAKYHAYSASGRSYPTDPKGECSCMDATMHSPEDGCKHNQKLIELLNRGAIPTPGESVAEWVETTLRNQIISAAERRSDLEIARDKAAQMDDSEHTVSDYSDAIDTVETILNGWREVYNDYRERVDEDVEPLPAIAQATTDSNDE